MSEQRTDLVHLYNETLELGKAQEVLNQVVSFPQEAIDSSTPVDRLGGIDPLVFRKAFTTIATEMFSRKGVEFGRHGGKLSFRKPDRTLEKADEEMVIVLEQRPYEGFSGKDQLKMRYTTGISVQYAGKSDASSQVRSMHVYLPLAPIESPEFNTQSAYFQDSKTHTAVEFQPENGHLIDVLRNATDVENLRSMWLGARLVAAVLLYEDIVLPEDLENRLLPESSLSFLAGPDNG